MTDIDPMRKKFAEIIEEMLEELVERVRVPPETKEYIKQKLTRFWDETSITGKLNFHDRVREAFFLFNNPQNHPEKNRQAVLEIVKHLLPIEMTELFILGSEFQKREGEPDAKIIPFKKK
ncbi:MAG: hypothetical protein HYV42_01020 [Candidatus Magasanikbacteria bacterium]|nr:hypothetical protein [Candidatus Magasanikbacteria bacterium]